MPRCERPQPALCQRSSMPGDANPRGWSFTPGDVVGCVDRCCTRLRQPVWKAPSLLCSSLGLYLDLYLGPISRKRDSAVNVATTGPRKRRARKAYPRAAGRRFATVNTSVFTSTMATAASPPPDAAPRCFVCLDPAKRNNIQWPVAGIVMECRRHRLKAPRTAALCGRRGATSVVTRDTCYR